MTMIDQKGQDVIWKHIQNHARDYFDMSYTRLCYLAEKCRPGERVLNIGVGSGKLEEILVNLGVEVWSLDPCGESIDRLRDELAMGNRAVQGYSNELPFQKDYFDKVIMTEVLEHLPDDILNKTLGEVYRVLKVHGVLTGTVPYRENLIDNNVICPHCETEFHRWGHQQSFDKSSLGEILIKHKFLIVQLYSRSFPDFRRPGFILFVKSLFRYVLGRLGEPLIAPNLYFVVHK